MAIFSRGDSATLTGSWASKRHNLSHCQLLSQVLPSESRPKSKLALISVLLWGKTVRKTHSFKYRPTLHKSKRSPELKREPSRSLKPQTKMSINTKRRRLMLTLSTHKQSQTRNLETILLTEMQHLLLKTARKHLQTVIYKLESRNLKPRRKV